MTVAASSTAELHAEMVAAAAAAGARVRVVGDLLVTRGGGFEVREATLAIELSSPGVGLAVLVEGTSGAERDGSDRLRVRYRVAIRPHS